MTRFTGYGTLPGGARSSLILDTEHPTELVAFSVPASAKLEKHSDWSRWRKTGIGSYHDIQVDGGNYRKAKIDGMHGIVNVAKMEYITFAGRAWSRDERFRCLEDGTDAWARFAAKIFNENIEFEEEATMNEEKYTYRTGTCSFTIGSDPQERWFIERTNTDTGEKRSRVFGSETIRDQSLRYVRDEGVPWMDLRSLDGSTGQYIHGGTYTNIVFDVGVRAKAEDPAELKAQERYDKLVVALEAEAEKRNWCAEWDAFKADNDVIVPEPPKKVYPAEPTGDLVTIKWEGWVPMFRSGYSTGRANWRTLASPTEAGKTWEYMVDTYGRDYNTGEPKPFQILYAGG